VPTRRCTLPCSLSDPPDASWSPEGDDLSVHAILTRVEQLARPHVVTTGGEPLLFEPVATLSARLAAQGQHVTIETAGTVTLEGLHCDLMSLSPKLSHSNPTDDATWALRHDERRRNLPALRALMAFDWQLKIVVRAWGDEVLAADVEEVEALLTDLGIGGRDRERVLLMPECTDRVRLPRDYDRLVPVCTARGFRLGPRLHIEIFGHRRGT
jgi:7-carboxy-7-deazaguanine synthase